MESLTSETCDTNYLRPCELMHLEMRLVPPCLKGPGSPWKALGLKVLLHSAVVLEQKCKLRIGALLVRGADKTLTVPPLLTAWTMLCGLSHIHTPKFGSSRCDSQFSKRAEMEIQVLISSEYTMLTMWHSLLAPCSPSAQTHPVNTQEPNTRN